MAGGLMQLVAYGDQDEYYTSPSPEDDSHEKKNKLKNNKYTIGDCNICYNENLEVYKCNNCVFLVCESCYIKTKNHNCVHCKNNF